MSMAERQADELLFQALKSGDQNAFEILFKTHYASLCKRALSIVHESSIAQEIVSDVFMNIWKKREKIEIHSSVLGYLFFSVRNHSLNYLKSRKMGYVDLEEVSNLLEAGGGDPVEQIISTEFLDEWEERIKRLPTQRQKVFRLNKLEGYTYREIAQNLNLSENTVRNQVQMAIKSLLKATNEPP